MAELADAMAVSLLLLLVRAILWESVAVVGAYETKKYALNMPNVNPFRDELYLCTPAKVVPERSFYIIGFEPNASMNRVHHMILFGCAKPGTPEPYWDCGEMASSNHNDNLLKANPCAEGSRVVYAWARDADALSLPEGVGFQVGNDTDIAYLVLQVHYAHKHPPEVIDASGVNLIYTEEPQNKLAGVLLLVTGGLIPPHQVTTMESECEMTEEKTIHPFAYRTHTHSLGKVVSGYHIRMAANGDDTWTPLGKRDPMTPQMFYPTFSREPIGKGDLVAARCTMKSDRDRVTRVGPTNEDEMCNFYLMYYVENTKPLEMKYCFTAGPPFHSWSSRPEFRHIPDYDASVLNM